MSVRAFVCFFCVWFVSWPTAWTIADAAFPELPRADAAPWSGVGTTVLTGARGILHARFEKHTNADNVSTCGINFPPHLLVVVRDPEDHYTFCVDASATTAEKEGPVVVYDTNEGSIEPYAEDFPAFYERFLREQLGGGDGDTAAS